MTREEKQLLLKDICARLPHGVIVDYKENEFELPHWKITTIYPDTFDGWIGYDKKVGAGSESGSRPFKIGEVKPYLRHMSSMTEEEAVEIDSMGFAYWTTMINNDLSSRGPMSLLDAIITHHKMAKLIDWLNAHHFDYHGLIEKGLALEAPEGMYKNE